MTIITTIPDNSIPVWQFRVDQFNAGSGENAITIEQFAQKFRDEETAEYVAAKIVADKASMGENERLMSLGAAVQAHPNKLDEIEKAVQKILSE